MSLFGKTKIESDNPEETKDMADALNDVVKDGFEADDHDADSNDSDKKKEISGIRMPKNPLNDNTMEFIERDKKQIIICGSFVAGMVVILLVCMFIKNMFHDELTDQKQLYADLSNEVEIFQSSNKYYTGVDGTLQNTTNTSVNWTGDKIDTGRWKADTDYFWTWINPAFSYKSAEEYAAVRMTYAQQLGHCLFVDQFMAPYDHTKDMKYDKNKDNELSPKEIEAANSAFKCTSDKNYYVTYPIGVKSDGSYQYMALVPMQSTGVVFTYTVIHDIKQDGTESILIDDFKCWPPDAKRPIPIGPK